MKTFEDFLKEQHAKEYHGTDDEMYDAYEAWVVELEMEELMKIILWIVFS